MARGLMYLAGEDLDWLVFVEGGEAALYVCVICFERQEDVCHGFLRCTTRWALQVMHANQWCQCRA
jgi:hypothetical protein